MTALHFFFPSCLLENDRSTISLSNLFIAAPQIYSLSFAPVYYSTTDLHFLFPPCLLEHDRSTLSLSALFITTRQTYTFSFASGFIRARWVCAFPFGSVCYDKSTRSLSVCLLQRERATVSLSVCLLQRERATVSLSVMFITTRKRCSFSFCLVY